jgi:hypothetical protein
VWNISSYSRILNDPRRLHSMRDLNMLTAAVASVSADKQARAVGKEKGKNKEKNKEKNKKKEEDEAKAAAKREELLPELTVLMKPYVEGIVDFNLLGQRSNMRLQDIGKYYFNASPPKLRSMKKEDLLSLIKHRLSPATATATAISTGGTAAATAMATATAAATATAPTATRTTTIIRTMMNSQLYAFYLFSTVQNHYCIF